MLDLIGSLPFRKVLKRVRRCEGVILQDFSRMVATGVAVAGFVQVQGSSLACPSLSAERAAEK